MDKVKKNRWQQTQQVIEQTLTLSPVDQFQFFSAVTKLGRAEVWQWIEQQIHLS